MRSKKIIGMGYAHGTVLGCSFSAVVFLLIYGCGGSDSDAVLPTSEPPVVEIEPADCGRRPDAGPTMTPGIFPVPPPRTIFIFAGQSNMVGFGYRPKLSVVPDFSNVAVWTGSQWEQYAVPQCFGPEVAFLAGWTASHSGERIGFIKVAYEGTSMREWRPDWIAAEAEYPAIGSPFETLVNTWQIAGSIPVAGIVWAQGESDAVETQSWPFYEERINRFISDLRARVGYVPFVFSETQWVGAPYIDVVRSAQAKLEARASTERICMARTGDVPTYSGGLHYNTAGQLLVGDRLFKRWTTC